MSGGTNDKPITRKCFEARFESTTHLWLFKPSLKALYSYPMICLGVQTQRIGALLTQCGGPILRGREEAQSFSQGIKPLHNAACICDAENKYDNKKKLMSYKELCVWYVNKEKRASEDEMAGWHHRCNGYELGQTPGVGDGQGGLACYSPWGCKESDTTGHLNNNNNM